MLHGAARTAGIADVALPVVGTTPETGGGGAAENADLHGWATVDWGRSRWRRANAAAIGGRLLAIAAGPSGA